MSVGVQAVVSDRDLALVRDMGSHPGDELRVVRLLRWGCSVGAAPLGSDHVILLINNKIMKKIGSKKG